MVATRARERPGAPPRGWWLVGLVVQVIVEDKQCSFDLTSHHLIRMSPLNLAFIMMFAIFRSSGRRDTKQVVWNLAILNTTHYVDTIRSSAEWRRL